MTDDLWYRTLDAKRRLFLPPRWAERLGGEEFLLAAGPDHSLLLLPLESEVPDGRAAHARNVVWNRIIIPKPLADYAGLRAGADCVLYASGAGLRLLGVEAWRRGILEEVTL